MNMHNLQAYAWIVRIWKLTKQPLGFSGRKESSIKFRI